MSIITNRDFWEKEILKDKKEIKQYLESGMINLKLLPPGKPLSLFIGGKYIKQNNMPNDSTYNKKEIKYENKNNDLDENNNKKDDSFNFDNFLNSQNINELFGLNDDVSQNLNDDKTNDKSYIKENIDNNILQNENNYSISRIKKHDSKSINQKNDENINYNIINGNQNDNNNNNKEEEDSFFRFEKNIENIFDIFSKEDSQVLNKDNEPISIFNNFSINNINNNNQIKNKESFDVEENLNEFAQEFDWDEEVDNCNLKMFGYKKFRPNQREIINASLCDRDIFVCMPTGGGKSLTYQIPALIREGVTMVVMPLLSLIQDQTTYLKGCGINVLFLNRENSMDLDYDKLFHSQNEEDLCKMIFLTPEKISKSPKTMDLLYSLYNEGLLIRCVVDEAHCVSQWGREFRSDYLNLKILKQKFPKLPILALTATAPNKIRDDVINQLGMKNTVFFRSSYNRKNLYIEIRKKTKDYINEIAKIIKEDYNHESGLIYCSTKKNCESMAKELKTKYKISCEYYHASLPDQKKNKIQEKWKNNQIQVIVATVAFGMGINKSDVRFVIHNSMPKSFESYYQEIGRAGRDGNKSQCILYYSPTDRRAIEFLVSNSNLDKKKISENLRKITQMMEYCEEEFECRRVLALEYFDEKFESKNCNLMCDNCNKKLSSVKKDCTKVSLIILDFVKNCSDKFLKFTVSQSIDYLMGKNGKSNMSWPMNDKNKGSLNKLSADSLKKIIRKLIIIGYIDEYLESSWNNIYSRIEISQKGINYLFNKNKHMDNVEDNIFISVKGKHKIEEEEEESDEEDVVEQSSSNKNSNGKEKENEGSEEKSEKKNKSTERRKKKKKKTEVDIEEEDFGLCENKKLFNSLFMKLKNERGEILKRENNDENDDDSEDFNLSVFKDKKKLGLDDIFTDNGLKELCRKLPTLEEELNINNIFGVNKESLKRYGKEFLPIINKFIEENSIKKEDLKKDMEKKEKEEKEKKKKKEKKNKKENGKKSEKKKEKEKEKKQENKRSEKKKEKEKKEENNEDIIIPENGVYALNEDDINYIDNDLLYEELSHSNNNGNDNNNTGRKNEDMDEDLESEEIKKEYESQKEKIDKEESDYLKQAKEIAKNNKKFKRSQLDSDSDDINEGKGKKKKNSLDKYNYFQKRAIWNKINKGKKKKK